jgi:hypothetical protein
LLPAGKTLPDTGLSTGTPAPDGVETAADGTPLAPSSMTVKPKGRPGK